MMGMTKTLTKSGVFSVLAIGTLILGCDATSSGDTTASASFTMTSGESGEAGTASTGGTTEGMVDIMSENMVDDLEDGDDAIIEQNERGGSWFLYNDETEGGMQSPDPNGSFVPTADCGPEGSGFCAQTTGSGFETWGAGMGFDFQNDGMTKTAYDAGEFTGIAFHAKGNVQLRVNLMTPPILDETLGGECVPEGGDTGSCGDGHGVDIQLTDTWTQYVVPFDSVAQVGWGLAAEFDPAGIVSMHFQVAQNNDFDISIDNIGLY